MMLEAQTIAEALGVKFPIDVERRIDGGAAVGAHRTSMLQDLDAGRPMEIDALVASVQELGRITGTPTPVHRHRAGADPIARAGRRALRTDRQMTLRLFFSIPCRVRGAVLVFAGFGLRVSGRSDDRRMCRGSNVKDTCASAFQLESLILAQNERWRQA
jgi:hypothetical protein